MILCPGDLRFGRLRRDALPQLSHGDPDDVAPELGDGILGRSGAQT
jgi:hypothetical protein